MNNQAILTEKTFENTPAERRDPFYPNVVLNFFGTQNETLDYLFVILLVFVGISFFIKNQKTFFFLVCGVGFWFYVMGCVYKNYEILSPKVAIIPLMIFAIVWLNCLEKKESKVESFVTRHSELIKVLHSKVTKDWYIVFATIFALSTFINTFTFAIDDYHRPFSNAKEVASFINEKMEPGSVAIEADPGSIFGSAVKAYIKNDVTIYNYVLGREEKAIDVLKYDNETVSKYHEKYNDGIKNEDLEKLLADMSTKYEHVYLFIVPPSCNSNYSDLLKVLNKYELLEVFNEKVYMDIPHTRSAVYKIK